MNICVLHAEYLGHDSGPTIVVRNLVDQWSRSNNVTVISGVEFKSLSNASVISTQSSRYLIWLLRTSGLRKILSSQDVIFDSACTIPTLLYAKLLQRVPIVALIHDDQYLEASIERRPYVARLRQYLLQKISIRLSNRTITVSEAARKRIVSRYGCESKISVIENGVDVEEFRDLGLERSEVILFVGDMSHFERKGISTLLGAMSVLVRESPKLKLVTIGLTNRRFGSEVERLGLRGNVESKGFLERQDLVRWYNRASVLVLPSRFEGFGLVVNEAMACSTPVIISDKVPASDVVAQARAGFIFPVGDVSALANYIRKLILDKELAREFGQHGREYVSAHLSWKQVAERYLSVFEEIIKHS